MCIVKKLWMIVAMFLMAGLLISSVLWAAPPQDYTLGCTFKNPDGTVFRIIKYYLRDGDKFRIDYLSADSVANTVEIYRKDKGLLWTVDPSFKNYTETALAQDAWENAVAGACAAEAHKQTKTGTTKFLNYPCDVYNAEKGGWTTISVVEPGANIILRSEISQNGKLAQAMEATEFNLAKPAAALFEIPAGYKRSE